jgi:hypothetical protein
MSLITDNSLFTNALQGISGMFMTQAGADQQSAGYNMSANANIMSGQAALQGSQFSANLAIQGGQVAAALAIQGANMDAARYQMAGSAAIAEGNYNVSLDQFNQNYKNDALAKQINDTFSSNRAIMGSSGISLGSKSYLAVTAATMSTFERQTVQMHNDSIVRERGLMYTSQVQATDAENQARTALYEGATAATMDNYKGAVSAAVNTYQGQVANQQYQYQSEVDSYKSDLAQSQAFSSNLTSGIKMASTLLSGV